MYSIFNISNIRIFLILTEELARNIAPTLLKNDNIPDIDELLNSVFTSLTHSNFHLYLKHVLYVHKLCVWL